MAASWRHRWRFISISTAQTHRIGVDTAYTRDRQHRAPPRRRPPLPAVRPAGPGGWRRPGRLHAPEAARTGPVSASRRYLSWSPRGRRVNGQNGHFSCQLGRNHVGTLGGRYGSGFNGPRDVLLTVPTYGDRGLWPMGQRPLLYQKAGNISKVYQTPRGPKAPGTDQTTALKPELRERPC